jgi:hypothetical protein
VVEVGTADRVVESVAGLPAVAEDLVVLHAGEGVLDAGPDLAVLLARQQGPALAFAVRDDEPGFDGGAVGQHRHALADGGPESRQAFACAVLPGTGRAPAMTSFVSASMMTCTFAENR